MKALTKGSNGRSGFTLIELLVVVAIIGIIAAIALPRLKQAIESAKQARTVTRLKLFRSALELYFLDHFKCDGAIEGTHRYPGNFWQLFHYSATGTLLGCQVSGDPNHPVAQVHWYIDGKESDYPEEVGNGLLSEPWRVMDYCGPAATHTWHLNRSVQNVDDGSPITVKGGWNYCRNPAATPIVTGTIWIDEDQAIMGGTPACDL